MAWQKSTYSNHPGTTSEVIHESSRVFMAICDTNPEEMYTEHKYNYSDLIQDALARSNAPLADPDTRTLVAQGIKDVSRVVQEAFIVARLTDVDVSERIAIATHPISAISLGILAARDNESMNTLIGDYPGGKQHVVLNSGNEYLTTRLQAHDGDRVCPFAGEKPAPIFLRFAKWAGEYAVHADDSSYKRRNGIC